MPWTAPAVQRTDPPLVCDERTRLDAALDYHRATLLRICGGLTAQQLAARPVPSSELSLLGLVRHQAANERVWFRIRFAGESVPDLYESADHPGGAEFALADPAGAEADFLAYAEEVTQARLVVTGRSLDDTFVSGGATADLRCLYAHMIGEYARHNGHADLLRELTDGTTGR